MGRRRHRGLLTLLLACMALAVVPTKSWGQQAARIGTVVAIDGKAEACAANADCTDNGTGWELLQFRAALFEHDTVRTEPASKIKILLRDDSLITLAERSTMVFTEFLLTPQQRSTVLSLALGKLRVVTKALGLGAGSGTEVRTQNTVAGVRGTTFVVIFIPPSTTEVVGFDGVVTVRHLNPAIPQIEPLPQHFFTRIVGNAAPSPAVRLSAEARQLLESELRLVEQVPVEVKPTGGGQSTGTIRGEPGDERQIERNGTPTRSTAIGEGVTGEDAATILERRVERTLAVLSSQASQPLGTAPVITPDNPTNLDNPNFSNPPPSLPLTVIIPRR